MTLPPDENLYHRPKVTIFGARNRFPAFCVAFCTRKFEDSISNVSSARAFFSSILNFSRDLLLTSFAGYSSIFIYHLLDRRLVPLLVRHFHLSSIMGYSVNSFDRID